MIDTDGNGKLSAEELQRVLVNGNWQPFNIETVRLLLNMFDRDHSGSISFEEFVGLWNYIENWKRCFQTFDRRQAGAINAEELQTALLRFGYQVSHDVVKRFIIKFDRIGHGNVTVSPLSLQRRKLMTRKSSLIILFKFALQCDN